MPGGSNMLTLAMRREHEDSKNNNNNNNNSDGYTRQRSRDNATGGDEFVDILQVQQLLLDSGVPTNGSGRNRSGRGRDQAPTIDGRGRLLDAFPAQSYYYGGYGQHHAPAAAASVDDLVALWFAGPTASGVFHSFYFIFSRSAVSLYNHHSFFIMHVYLHHTSTSYPLHFLYGQLTKSSRSYQKYSTSTYAARILYDTTIDDLKLNYTASPRKSNHRYK